VARDARRESDRIVTLHDHLTHATPRISSYPLGLTQINDRHAERASVTDAATMPGPITPGCDDLSDADGEPALRFLV
jgi:hypothetical protein